MPRTKCGALKINGCSLNVPKPLKHCGYTFGNHDSKSHITVRSDPMTEEKAYVNKSIQASLDKEENILEKFKSLQKDNLQLKSTLKEKDSTISRLRKITENQAAEYTTAIELEKEHQKQTEKQLEESEHLVKEKVKLLDEAIQYYTKILQEQHTQHAELVSEMKKQNAVDIRNREEKIARLRQCISDTFQEKSREHHQQMEELRRELNKCIEKTRILKIKLDKEISSKKVREGEYVLHQDMKHVQQLKSSRM